MVLWGGVLLVGSYPVEAQPPEPAEWPARKPSALLGQRIFQSNCVRCHGPQGAGDGEMVPQLPAAPPSFQDVTHMRQVTPAEYFDIITNGNLQALMPPWNEALTAQERWDVLFYVWSLSTDRQQIETGEKIYAQECAACHGDAGDKVASINLSSQEQMALLSQADLADGIRNGHAAVAWSDSLTDADRWAVADYVRTFTYEPVFAAVEAMGEGVIAGRVVGGTAGVEPDLQDVELALYPFVGQTALPPITTTVAADGSFRFEGLATDPERNYGLQATYRGVEYFYPEVINLGEEPEASITMPVYETTTDGSAITVERNHVIIDFVDNQLEVAELYIFHNAGDRAFVGAETLKFPLPAGARNLQFEDPRMAQSTQLKQDGVVDSLPVPPGNRQVLLSYRLPYEGTALEFVKPIVYETGSVNFFIADAGVTVEAGSLQEGEPIFTQTNTRFLSFARENVPAGEVIVVKLSNLPKGSLAGAGISVPPDRSGTLRWLGLGFVLLAITFVLAYPAVRPRLLEEPAGSADVQIAMLRRRRQRLLEELADLDDAFEAGEIGEETYIQTRADVKAELIEVMQQLQRYQETE